MPVVVGAEPGGDEPYRSCHGALVDLEPLSHFPVRLDPKIAQIRQTRLGDALPDVFLSYSRQDRDLALEVAHYLQQNGLDVWWDSALSAGENFRDTVTKQLDAAKAVIVLWSPDSMRSQWVLSEASHALSTRKLISLRTPDLPLDRIPPPFNTLHILDVEDARKSDAVLEAVRRLTGQAEPRAASVPPSASSTPPADTDTVPAASLPASPLALEESYDVFVAYSRKDTIACEELVLALRQQELVVFYDQSLKSGDRWRAVIANNIQKSPVFVVLLSKDSMASSEVEGEVNLAKDSTASITPVRIDATDLTPTFKLMLGNINFIDAARNREIVFTDLAQQIRTTVALRAFAARRVNQQRATREPLAATGQHTATNKTASLNRILLPAALLFIFAGSGAAFIASRSLGFLPALGDPERVLVSLVAFGVPYALVCVAAARAIFR